MRFEETGNLRGNGLVVNRVVIRSESIWIDISTEYQLIHQAVMHFTDLGTPNFNLCLLVVLFFAYSS